MSTPLSEKDQRDLDLLDPTPQFSLTDCCDRCGAQAKLRVAFTTGDLMFCGHHGREFMPALVATALAVASDTVST